MCTMLHSQSAVCPFRMSRLRGAKTGCARWGSSWRRRATIWRCRRCFWRRRGQRSMGIGKRSKHISKHIYQYSDLNLRQRVQVWGGHACGPPAGVWERIAQRVWERIAHLPHQPAHLFRLLRLHVHRCQWCFPLRQHVSEWFVLELESFGDFVGQLSASGSSGRGSRG